MLGRDMADDGRAARETVTTARDTEVADTGRAGPRRDPATDPTARDPAPAPFARDRRYGTRSGTGSFRPRPTVRHAIRHRLFSPATDGTARDPAPAPFARDRPSGTRSGTGSFRTRPTLWHVIRHQTRPHATTLFCPTMSGCPDMSGSVRICPVMSGLFGIVCRRDVIGVHVRHEP